MVVYTTNPNVMHETIDDETIVIHLATGTYYSLRGSGSAIWNAIDSGTTRDVIVAGLESAYEAPPGAIATATDAFLSELEAEQLIARGTSGGSGGEPILMSAQTRSAFEEPELAKYDDMQDIILLDPVHMVDDQGWPNPAPVEGKPA